jgi:hypothetical protein
MVTAPGVAPDLECSLAAVQISDDQEQGSEASKLFIASNGHGNMVSSGVLRACITSRALMEYLRPALTRD